MRAFDASRVVAAVVGATASAAPATLVATARCGTCYPRTRGVLTPYTALSWAESGIRTHRHRVALEPRSRGAPGARVNADNANATRTRLLWGASAKHRPAARLSWDESPKRRAERHDPDDAPEANGLGPLGNGPPVRDRTGLPKETPVRRHPGCRGGLRPRRPQFKHRRHIPAHRGAVPTIARSVDPAMTITPLPGLDGTAHRSGNATASGRAATGIGEVRQGRHSQERRSEHAGEPHPKKHAQGCGFPCACTRPWPSRPCPGSMEPGPSRDRPTFGGVRPQAAARQRGMERSDKEGTARNVAAGTLTSCTLQNTRGTAGFHAYPGASGGIAATRPQKGHSCPRTPTARCNAPTLGTRGQPHFALIPGFRPCPGRRVDLDLPAPRCFVRPDSQGAWPGREIAGPPSLRGRGPGSPP